MYDDYNEFSEYNEYNEINFERELRELTSTADEMSILDSLKITPQLYCYTTEV